MGANRRRAAARAWGPFETCRGSGEVTISRTTETSVAVNRVGEDFGQDDWSSGRHPRSALRHARTREAYRPTMARTRRRPNTPRVRRMARSSWAFSGAGTRRRSRSGFRIRSSAKRTWRTALWSSLRLSRRATLARNSATASSAAPPVVTARGARASHPATVDLGTPRRVAIAASLVRWTSWTSRWS